MYTLALGLWVELYTDSERVLLLPTQAFSSLLVEANKAQHKSIYWCPYSGFGQFTVYNREVTGRSLVQRFRLSFPCSISPHEAVKLGSWVLKLWKESLNPTLASVYGFRVSTRLLGACQKGMNRPELAFHYTSLVALSGKWFPKVCKKDLESWAGFWGLGCLGLEALKLILNATISWTLDDPRP